MKDMRTFHFMRRAWLALLMLSIAVGCSRKPENSVTKIFVVRHAERYPGFNGSLTWKGRIRAGDLMRCLEASGIRRIYFTPFARCEMTADSLRLLQHIDTAYYKWDTTGSDLVRQLQLRRDYGKNILVIGHANTVPAILRELGAAGQPVAIPDSVYDNLFEVIIDHGKVSLHQMKYGAPSR